MTGFSRVLFPNNENPCLSREVVRVEMTNQDTVVQAAQKALINNSVYTGVSDTTALKVKEIKPLFGCTICEGKDVNSVPIEWKVTFEEQKIDSHLVRNTSISVVIDAEGVNRIWGNWYSDIKGPAFLNYGYVQARESFVGWKFDMRGYTGEETIYTVEPKDLKGKPVLEYYPVKRNDMLEMRQVWKVPIECSTSAYAGWSGFVDVMDGTLINILPR